MNEAPRDVYVITTAKKRDSGDWMGDFARIGVGTSKDATVAGVLTVDSWNNLKKYEGVKDAFFIFDEQRLVGAGAWTKAFIKIARSNRWILLTATPGDTWLDYIAVFIANGFYKNRTEFKREHVVYSSYSKFPKVERYVAVGRLVRQRNDILVEMPYVRHTTRKTVYVPIEVDTELFERVHKKRWNVFKNQPIRDAAEWFFTMRKVANSAPARLEAVKTLLEKHDRLIVFYNFDYELEALRCLKDLPPRHVCTESSARSGSGKRSGSAPAASQPSTTASSPSSTGGKTEPLDCSCKLVVAEWNGHKHENVPDSKRWVYLVQYIAGAEAWECTTTDAMCFYSLTYSYKNYHQAHGRIDRLNTPYSVLWYYVLRSGTVIDTVIYGSLKKKHNFNESAYSQNWEKSDTSA